MRLITPLALLVFLMGCSNNDADSPTGPSSAGPLWSASGVGNDVRTKPPYVQRLRIQGQYSGRSENFIVWCGSNLLVNELLGTAWGPTSYAGTHATANCSQIEIRDSTGVTWQMTEVR